MAKNCFENHCEFEMLNRSARKLTKLNSKQFSDGDVDPDAKKFDDANIYGKNGLKYSVMLYFVDVSSNKNSYFKLQLIESSGRYTYDQSSKLVLNK